MCIDADGINKHGIKRSSQIIAFSHRLMALINNATTNSSLLLLYTELSYNHVTMMIIIVFSEF